MARSTPLDAIVLDQRMPHMTGAEVVRALRREGLATPIVFISAARDVRALAVELGLDCVLQKPFDTEDLLEAIRQTIVA